MGTAFGNIIAKAPVNDKIVSFLDNWSSATTCASGTSDIANVADADVEYMSIRYGTHVYGSQRTLYIDSFEYPNGIRTVM